MLRSAMTTVDEMQERIDALEASNAELRRQVKLYGPPTDRQPGSRVVLVFFGLISLSMLVALGLWNMGRRTARERALRAPTAPTAARVDQAGWSVVQGLHRCLADTQLSDEVDVRIEARLTPAGTLGLVEASAKPKNDRFVPCVRQVTGAIKLEPDSSTGAPIIEVRYLVERPQESTYQARWSWRQIP